MGEGSPEAAEGRRAGVGWEGSRVMPWRGSWQRAASISDCQWGLWSVLSQAKLACSPCTRSPGSCCGWPAGPSHHLFLEIKADSPGLELLREGSGTSWPAFRVRFSAHCLRHPSFLWHRFSLWKLPEDPLPDLLSALFLSLAHSASSLHFVPKNFYVRRLGCSCGVDHLGGR